MKTCAAQARPNAPNSRRPCLTVVLTLTGGCSLRFEMRSLSLVNVREKGLYSFRTLIDSRLASCSQEPFSKATRPNGLYALRPPHPAADERIPLNPPSAIWVPGCRETSGPQSRYASPPVPPRGAHSSTSVPLCGTSVRSSPTPAHLSFNLNVQLTPLPLSPSQGPFGSEPVAAGGPGVDRTTCRAVLPLSLRPFRQIPPLIHPIRPPQNSLTAAALGFLPTRDVVTRR
ncbi:hypothetical protein C8Q73DRAFT_282444 [Cubamyces lactineus]|nr:hypothetical protein C8Q73DRAFT_282444 [Cubamyces lactineus]